MRTTLRGLKVGVRVRFQPRPHARKRPGTIEAVHENGTVSVAVDGAGVYLAPVTPEARKAWERSSRRLCATWMHVPVVEVIQNGGRQ